ncbi:MAG: hypothetical protein H7Y20_14660, partial [Bryobacteraceae bacterium]|nr:hypothetical protein [Bryobacteraceae bacterium]
SYIRVVKGVTPLADGKIHLHFFPFMKEQAFVNAIEIVPSGRGKIRPVRIVARSSTFVDRDKQEWGPDRFYEGGQYVQRHEPVLGADQPELFQGERYGNFSYAIPVAAKSHYTLTLRFAESWFGPGRPGGGGQGSRSFDVYCNGRALLRRFDPFEAAGGALRAITKTFSHLEATPQGKLLIQFIPMENYALINSIEVTDEGF